MPKKTGRKLVIVESPAKAKTINKFLGRDFVVKASMGHVRDLPSKGMGVDLKTFQPEYEVIGSRSKVLTELKKAAKASDEVFLATDLDREGEAIAWHLKEALKVPDAKARRVIFNAITKNEIQKAFARPLKINMDRVNAQQARRILDRVVGYEVSPLLWRKVARGLSAGRVQSVAVRLVVERQREIEKFIPSEYWKIAGVFTTGASEDQRRQLVEQWSDFLNNTGNGERTKAEQNKWLLDHGAFAAELTEFAGRKFEPDNVAQARQAAEALGFVVEREIVTEDPEAKGPARRLVMLVGQLGRPPAFTVRSIERKRTTSRPPPPFITSTLQQAASSRLGMNAQSTMRTAQRLYETGYITYMRTDSTHLSDEALKMVRDYIGREFGNAYVPEKPNFYASSNRSAQEAHEAIRPTDASFTPARAKADLGPEEHRLYQLIWTRFVACQMPPAEWEQTVATIVAPTHAGQGVFRATGRRLVFDGYLRLVGVPVDEPILPELQEQASVQPLQLAPTQHFTQPPPRYTEASLVKKLEELGIGRPSTYASIIQTIQDRQYVQQIDRRFHATLLGRIVTDKLMEAFGKMMDYGFTADMESQLDQIEERHIDWIKWLRAFYGPFHKDVQKALKDLEHAGGTPSPYTCEKCGRPMVYRIGKTGFFLSCTGRPDCNETRPVDAFGKPTVREVSEHRCPACGRQMIKRKGRFGFFLGCAGYSIKKEDGTPQCSVIVNLDKQGNPLPPKARPVATPVPCPKCGSPMLLREGKRGPFLGCSKFPRCRTTRQVKKLEGEQLKAVEALLPQLQANAAEALATAARVLAAPATPPRSGPTSVPTDIDCEECGKPMVIRQGSRGPFLGCSGYPKCRHTADVPARLLEEMEGKNGAPSPAAQGGDHQP